ncbi:NBS-LRR type disease resistance protein [Quillaja saponaria]|uniref:NBS-LRR type disease resistance protein n=1 Tax=Quillaja saponaria TaxID=32244 RepID=A0AAD7PBZ1_QUISA|nr:NBS-LRR type disease resistance protein [Quillaja saponaria]
MAAESVLLGVANKIIGRLGSLALVEIGLLWNVKDEIRKMKKSVTAIKAVLLDAEAKQDTNAGVREWVERLKDAALDADDLLDDFSTEVLHRQLMTQNKQGKKVRIFFSKSNQLVYAHKMGRKLRKIRERLDEINDDKSKCGLIERSNPQGLVLSRVRKQTHSFILEEEVIGREEEKKTIIDLLLNINVKENVSVVPIVGIGGLGKTTLSQLVYNDKIIQNHFDLKMWVCVPDDFDVQSIVAKMVQCPTNSEMEQMQQNLRKKIEGKRYLLVLDDVWNDNKEKWLKLKSLLMGGAKGSQIIVTTRLEKVVEITRTISSFHLKGLDKDKSWLLFTRVAFENGEEPQNGDLVVIGKKIVRKCTGVPLAIRTIGSMLYFKNSEKDWLYFLNTDLLKINQQDNDISPILKLSYDHLSPHLKNCFAYCSLFPKDFQINKKTLIQLWMAQGFIQISLDESRCMEDVGEEYFMDLYWRSFFKDIEKDGYGDIEVCKMHDLFHDLAQLVAGNEYTVTNLEGEKIGETTRHVSINATNLDFTSWKISTGLADQVRKLRSFHLPFQQIDFGGCVTLDTAAYDSVISSFKRLRMLDLQGFCNKTLPDSIGSLKHLRYLDLSRNKRIEMLPSSVTSLHHLQTLKLSHCSNLKELPRDMRNLMSLRHLELDNGAISELSSLNNLTGSLIVKGLSNLHGNAISAAKLAEKPFLKSLTLSWEADRSSSDESLLEGLQPHSKLKSLTINYFGGVRFCGWLSSLSNLYKFEINGCDKLQYIPPLHQLLHLQCLTLRTLPCLEYIDSDGSEKDCCLSSSTSSSSPLFFPSLKSLELIQIPNLRGWWGRSSCQVAHLASFSCLSELCIINCPNLISLPLRPRVEQLTYHGVGERIFLQFLPPIKTTTAGGSQTHIHTTLQPSSSSLSTLRHLECSIPDLQSFPKELLENFTSLHRLTIVGCDRLKSISPILLNLSALQHLSIFCGKELDLCNDEEDGDYGMLWKELCSLRILRLLSLPKLVSLPEGLQHVTTLEDLSISVCRNLQTLSGWIGNFQSSLRRLDITKCPKLTSLPEGMCKLRSLRKLEIAGCPHLQVRCKREVGEDWH